MELSDYELREWDRLQRRKASALGERTRHLLPDSARGRISAAVDAVKENPWADTAADTYAAAARGFGSIIGGAASHTMKADGVVKQYQDAGYSVRSLGAIRDLDLEIVDSVARLNRVRYGHSSSAAASGVASGAAITGAGVALLKGSSTDKGAKKAPSFEVVAGAMAADVAAVLGIAARTVAATAQWYGYDPRKPEEQVFLMSVLGLGMAAGTQAKAAAYAELSQLTQLLFRNATWARLEEKVLTQVAQQFASRFSVTLTKKKFGQVVPIVGIAVGGALNFATIARIASAANDAYRERFLIDRSGGELSSFVGDEGPAHRDPEVIDVVELLEEAEAPAALEPGADIGTTDEP